MLELQGGELQAAGFVKARPGPGKDEVTVTSPDVLYDATVSLKPDVMLGAGEPILVGPVQTVMGGERVGVYRRGGAADGEVLAEQIHTIPQAWDATYQDTKKQGRTPDVPRPWYSRPSAISDSIRSTTFRFFDRPDQTFPVAWGGGQITETRGKDRFVVSVAAKRGERLVHLKSSSWEVPWDLKLDPQHTGQGGAVSTADARDAPPAGDPWSFAAAQEWTAFNTVEAAMTATPEVLMQSLLPAKAKNEQAWRNIAEALRRKNPVFHVVITADQVDAWVGGDELALQANGHQTAMRSLGTLSKGASATVNLPLNEILCPEAIQPGTLLDLRVSLIKWLTWTPRVKTVEWRYPFYPQPTPVRLKGEGAGSYSMTGSLR